MTLWKLSKSYPFVRDLHLWGSSPLVRVSPLLFLEEEDQISRNLTTEKSLPFLITFIFKTVSVGGVGSSGWGKIVEVGKGTESTAWPRRACPASTAQVSGHRAVPRVLLDQRWDQPPLPLPWLLFWGKANSDSMLEMFLWLALHWFCYYNHTYWPASENPASLPAG